MIGVNLAGGEFGSVGGAYGSGYIYPSMENIDYYASKGMELIRLPFKWERLQPNENGPLDAAELGRIREIVDYAATKGMTVALDVHNYGMAYGGKLTGSAELPNSSFADFWSKVATEFKGDANVMFNLMNEPYKHSAAEWLESANAAIQAIRETGADQKILVPGTIWSGAHSWMSSDNHSVVGAGVIDPLDNYAFEVHQYLDGDSSGTSAYAVSETIGAERLTAITEWAKANGHELFLGEFGAAQNATSLAALDNMMQYMDENADVWIGATYWAGGPWWGDYIFSIEPDENGNDKPQMAILQKYDLASPDRQDEPAEPAPVVAVEPEQDPDQSADAPNGNEGQDTLAEEVVAPTVPDSAAGPTATASTVGIDWAEGEDGHYDEGETMAFTISVQNAREGQKFDLWLANEAGADDFENTLLDDLLAAAPEGVSVDAVNGKHAQITLKEGSYDFTFFREAAMDGVAETTDQAWWADGDHEQADFWLSNYQGGLTSEAEVASVWIRDVTSSEPPAPVEAAVAEIPVEVPAEETQVAETGEVAVPTVDAPAVETPDAEVPQMESLVAAPLDPVAGDVARWEKLIEQFVGKLEALGSVETGKMEFKGEGFAAGNHPIDASAKIMGRDIAFELSGRLPLDDFDWMNQTLADAVVDGAREQHSCQDC